MIYGSHLAWVYVLQKNILEKYQYISGKRNSNLKLVFTCVFEFDIVEIESTLYQVIPHDEYDSC